MQYLYLQVQIQAWEGVQRNEGLNLTEFDYFMGEKMRWLGRVGKGWERKRSQKWRKTQKTVIQYSLCYLFIVVSIQIQYLFNQNSPSLYVHMLNCL